MQLSTSPLPFDLCPIAAPPPGTAAPAPTAATVPNAFGDLLTAQTGVSGVIPAEPPSSSSAANVSALPDAADAASPDPTLPGASVPPTLPLFAATPLLASWRSMAAMGVPVPAEAAPTEAAEAGVRPAPQLPSSDAPALPASKSADPVAQAESVAAWLAAAMAQLAPHPAIVGLQVSAADGPMAGAGGSPSPALMAAATPGAGPVPMASARSTCAAVYALANVGRGSAQPVFAFRSPVLSGASGVAASASPRSFSASGATGLPGGVQGGPVAKPAAGQLVLPGSLPGAGSLAGESAPVLPAGSQASSDTVAADLAAFPAPGTIVLPPASASAGNGLALAATGPAPASASGGAIQVKAAFDRLSATAMPTDANSKSSSMPSEATQASSAPAAPGTVVPGPSAISSVAPQAIATLLPGPAPTAPVPLVDITAPATTSTDATVPKADGTPAPANVDAITAAERATPQSATSLTVSRLPAKGSGRRDGASEILAGNGVSGAATPRSLANFAGLAVRPADTASGDAEGQQKHLLEPSQQKVNEASSGLGINAAHPGSPMPTPASTPPVAAPAPEPTSFSAAPLSFDALVRQAAPDPASDVGRAAHRAVDSALAMADHFSDGAQRGVSLQFSVSGVDLAVRVEMRADGVHTTFRTESPELRAALAHEWQTVVSAQPGERAQKLADPIFTSSNGGSSTATDSGAANQRDRSTPQGQQQASPGTPARHLTRQATASTGGVPAAPVSRIIPVSTALHLHTFA